MGSGPLSGASGVKRQQAAEPPERYQPLIIIGPEIHATKQILTTGGH